MTTAIARPAEARDLADVAALFVDAVAELATLRGGGALLANLHRGGSVEESLSAALADPNTMLWCGVWEEAVVGYAIASASIEGDAEIVTITDLYTTPQARDVGVGEILLETMIEWSSARRARAIDAYALPGARESKNLFERLGLTARLITVRRELS